MCFHGSWFGLIGGLGGLGVFTWICCCTPTEALGPSGRAGPDWIPSTESSGLGNARVPLRSGLGTAVGDAAEGGPGKRSPPLEDKWRPGGPCLRRSNRVRRRE